mmetsp:Transcript_23789/g.36478  ORF Transcript_23789/g.36478 Transcript_23789/m.36478 type:complete len:148 (+) Transcript_23789:924-1367(+)
MRNGEFSSISSYLSSLIQGATQFSEEIRYLDCSKPLFRGINPNFVNLDEYKVGSIGVWPCLNSTSKNMRKAYEFTHMSQFPKIEDINEDFIMPRITRGLIFQIYLSAHSSPATHIDLTTSNRLNLKDDEWSFHQSEEEVLLLPFFCY